MRIPWLGFEEDYKTHRAVIDRAIQRVIQSGDYQRGKEVHSFEREFAEYCGVAHGIGTNSCYAAMFLALLACGVGPGDEVITVPNTDIATTAAISHTGASFVWVDIDPKTYNIDPQQIEQKITERTKAILPVHLYGLPAEMDSIMAIAKRHSLRVITDNALAVGARYQGTCSGAIGHLGCFSFVYGKGLGTFGDAGMVVTEDLELAEKVRHLNLYHDGTMRTKTVGGIQISAGFNYQAEGHYTRLVPLHAAILREKLGLLDGWIEQRRVLAESYGQLLQDSRIVLPYEPPKCRHAYRNYTIRVANRDRVREALATRGIETGLHYVPPLHLQPVYEHHGEGASTYPAVEQAAEELLTLPMYPELPVDATQLIAQELLASLAETQ